MLQEGPGGSKGGDDRRGMGEGPAQGTSDFPGLTGPLPSPYLLVYDGEDDQCQGLVDWIQKRDRSGLVVAFPFQNTELLHVAPELAGMALDRGVHGFDPRTRAVHSGPRLLPCVLGHLPGWRWVAPLARIPFVSRLLYAIIWRWVR